MSKVCRKCNEEKPLTPEFFGVAKSNKDGFRSECRICFKAYMKTYYKKNKKRLLQQNKEYASKNKDVVNERKTRWAKENIDKVKKAQEKFRLENPDKRAAWEAKRRSAKKQALPKWADLEKIDVIYEKVKWLEDLTGLKYHVDHIIPLQGENVCGLHIWENLQILEDNINFSKGNRLG